MFEKEGEKKHEKIEKNISFGASGGQLCATDEQLEEVEPAEPEWNLKMVEGQNTQNAGTQNVKIAIMDSGIEEISNVNVKGSVNLVENEQDITSYMNDMTGHGTAVASIVQSLNRNADIYSVRVLDMNNQTDLERLIRGIYWCIDNNIDVINMSFGTQTRSSILGKAIKDADDAGIVMVAAAGNSGEAGVEYPAAYKDTIAVGAVDHEATKTSESSVGNEVDVAAPGENIGVETIFGMHTWADGTSMAAPHVTAEAGLILAKDKNKDGAFVKGLVSETAKDAGSQQDCGEGLIDINSALQQYDTYDANYEEEGGDTELPANEDNVQTFDNGDVSLGARWGTVNHQGSIQNAVDNLNATGEYDYISLDALTAMKMGGTYQDRTKNSEGQDVFTRYWHGAFKRDSMPRINYIACYRFITKIAAYDGDTQSFTKGVTGMSTNAFNSMKSMVHSNQIKGYNDVWRDWDYINSNSQRSVMGYDPTEPELPLYRGSNTRKSKLKKCFLYGMAIHAATDAFAHSAFKMRNQNSQIKHWSDSEHTIMEDINGNGVKDADDAYICPNRFVDAKAAAQKTVKVYLKKISDSGESGIGGIGVFAPAIANRGAAEGYYLANVKSYAIEANGGENTTDFNAWFDYINYSYPTN